MKTRKRFRAHQSIHREITLHPSRGVHAQLLAGDRLPVLFGDDRDLPCSAALQVGLDLHRGRCPCRSRVTGVRIAAMPIAGIAGMKNVTLTSAPEMGEPLASVSFTRKMLLPLCGGVGSEVNSTFAWGAFIADAAPAPGGGGTNEPSAA